MEQKLKKRFVTSVGAFFSVSALFGVANAQEQELAGPSTTACDGQYNMTFDGAAPYERLFSYAGAAFWLQERTYTLPAPVPAGTYNLTAVSYDGYPDRVTATQPQELWFLQLLDADSNVLATSGVTADLVDLVAEAEWIGGIGQVTWAGADAVQVKAVHGWQQDGSPNSVAPLCFGADVDPDSTTTTVPEETSTTTTVPEETSTTTTVPVETTTTVGTEVLPETTTPAADPVDGTPSFTG